MDGRFKEQVGVRVVLEQSCSRMPSAELHTVYRVLNPDPLSWESNTLTLLPIIHNRISYISRRVT